MSRDMMGAFELYQPDTVEGAVELLERFGADGWAMAGGNDSLDWFKDRVKRPKYVVDLTGIGALKGIRDAADGGIEIGALTTLTEIERSDVVRTRYKVLADAARQSREPANQKHRHDRRQRLPGRALLVLPLRRGLLSSRRQRVLRGYARGAESRALSVGRRSLRRREPVRYGPGARGAECDDGHRRPERRAHRARRGVFHRPEHRHHAHDGAPARRGADGDPNPGRILGRDVLLREGRGSQHLGLPAREHRGRDGHERPDDREDSARGRRRAMRAAPSDRGRGSRDRPAEKRRDRDSLRVKARCAAPLR